jgi:hypothetical protein
MATVMIDVTRFQPFGSRVGKDKVVGLKFSYSPAVVRLLKDAMQAAARSAGLRSQGGWLDEHRCWYVEPAIWPPVREKLIRAGCTLRGDPEFAREEEARRLREIEQRLTAAAPGSRYWKDNSSPGAGWPPVNDDSYYRKSFNDGTRGGFYLYAEKGDNPTGRGVEVLTIYNGTVSVPEAALIASAPDDLRYLLDLVRFQAALIYDLREEQGKDT